MCMCFRVFVELRLIAQGSIFVRFYHNNTYYLVYSWIRGKASLSWITQEIRTPVRKKDHLLRKFEMTGNSTFHVFFLCVFFFFIY